MGACVCVCAQSYHWQQITFDHPISLLITCHVTSTTLIIVQSVRILTYALTGTEYCP
jgi:hypothetical protein